VTTWPLPRPLEVLVDSYPLYSDIDEALFRLATFLSREANAMRAQKNVAEANREKVVANWKKKRH